VAKLSGPPSLHLDGGLIMPLSFHLGYHGLPLGGILPGFGHVGLGGSLGWADPRSGLAFGFVHNRLLTPMLMSDQAGFVATAAFIRRGVFRARRDGYNAVTKLGAPFSGLSAAV
jgi:CubicO group peptidase (beta-lactamase class C family)